MTFSLQKENPLVSRSSIPFSIGYSSNGSLTGNIRANIFGRNDKWRLIVDYWFKKMPDHYWGVGYENAINIPKSDSTTRYDRDWIKFTAKLGFRIKKHFYFGPILDINETKASNINERMAMDPDYLLTGPNSRNSGIGFLLQFDSRDFATSAYKGVYCERRTSGIATAGLVGRAATGFEGQRKLFSLKRESCSVLRPHRTDSLAEPVPNSLISR